MLELPENLQQGTYADPYFIEYVKRTTAFSMLNNHFHPFYEIYFLLSGKRLYFVKDSIYPVEAGDLVFIDQNQVHKTLDAEGSHHERIVIHIDQRFVRDHLMEHASLLLQPFHQTNPVIRIPADLLPRLMNLIERSLEELNHRPIGCEVFFVHAITELLLTGARHLAEGKPIDLEGMSPMHSKISEVVRYLNLNFANPIRIPELAKDFYFSPYYLSRMFKEITGFTLIDYLNLTRIKEAQRLLRESDLSVSDVAQQVGFDNFSHFGKMFKRLTQMSPREYRKEQRDCNSMRPQ